MIFTDRMKICLRDFADLAESWNLVWVAVQQTRHRMRIELLHGEIAFDEQGIQLTLTQLQPINRE